MAMCVAGAQESPPPANPASAAKDPIPLRNQRPYNLLFLQFAPESGQTLSANARRFSLQLDIANNLLVPNPAFGATVREDNETQRLLGAWRQGLGRETEIGVFVPILWRNGGFLDDLVSGYHSFFGIPGVRDNPAGRSGSHSFASHLQLADANGVTRIDSGNAFGLGETLVTVKHGFFPSESRGNIALRLGLKLPTGNPTLLLGSGGVDTGASLDAHYSLGRNFVLYANAGYTFLGHSQIYGSQNHMFQGMYAIEYRPNSRDRYIAQVDGNSLAIRTGNRVADRDQVTATFGYRRILDPHHNLYAAFSENGDISIYKTRYFANIGPDITFSFGYEWRP